MIGSARITFLLDANRRATGGLPASVNNRLVKAMAGKPPVARNASGMAWRIRFVVVGLVFVLGLVAIAEASTSKAQLRDATAVRTAQVTLQDVAKLTGDYAQTLADLVITNIDPTQRTATVTLGQVREKLTQEGVNWGTLSLRGYTACRVTWLADPPTPPVSDDAPALANPMQEIGLRSPLTLRDRAIEMIQRFASVDPSDLRITFSPNDADTLAQGAWQDRYECEPLASAPLGRVPLVIRRYRGDRLVATYRITADVARRYLAVVATRSIGRGQTFAPGDVQIQERYLDTNTAPPLTDLSDVIGQTSGTVLRPGLPVYAHHLRSPLLVRRGELITVRSISGGLVVKAIGRAGEDGERDQVIQVRNTRSRDSFAVRVTGPQEGVTVDTDPQNTLTQNQRVDPQPHRSPPR